MIGAGATVGLPKPLSASLRTPWTVGRLEMDWGYDAPGIEKAESPRAGIWTNWTTSNVR